jgi:hypothetical protein
MTMDKILYECGICDCFHPWNWNGDCRDDDNRYFDPEEYASKHNIRVDEIEIRSMDDRVAADQS